MCIILFKKNDSLVILNFLWNEKNGSKENYIVS